MASLQAQAIVRSFRATNIRSSLTAAPKRTGVIYLISLHISLAGLLYGLDTGSIGPITEMPQFIESVGKLSDSTQGLYVSSVLLFAGLSSVADGYLADLFSRKYTVFFGAVFAFGIGIEFATIVHSTGDIWCWHRHRREHICRLSRRDSPNSTTRSIWLYVSASDHGWHFSGISHRVPEL